MRRRIKLGRIEYYLKKYKDLEIHDVPEVEALIEKVNASKLKMKEFDIKLKEVSSQDIFKKDIDDLQEIHGSIEIDLEE